MISSASIGIKLYINVFMPRKMFFTTNLKMSNHINISWHKNTFATTPIFKESMVYILYTPKPMSCYCQLYFFSLYHTSSNIALVCEEGKCKSLNLEKHSFSVSNLFRINSFLYNDEYI